MKDSMQVNRTKYYGFVLSLGLLLSCVCPQRISAWGPLSVGLVGVGTFSGCYALHLTFKSDKTVGNKLCSLVKAGCAGTIGTLCILGGILAKANT